MRSSEARAAASAVAALLAVLMMALGGAGEGNIPACVQKLIPCARYLGSPKPADSCCGPLREVVRNEPPCLCSIVGNTQLLQAFHVNLTQAHELPKYCGVTFGQNTCTAVSTDASFPDALGGKNIISAAAAAVARMGVSGVVGFLVSWSLVG